MGHVASHGRPLSAGSIRDTQGAKPAPGLPAIDRDQFRDAARKSDPIGEAAGDDKILDRIWARIAKARPKNQFVARHDYLWFGQDFPLDAVLDNMLTDLDLAKQLYGRLPGGCRG